MIEFEHIPEVAGLGDQRKKSTCSAEKVRFAWHFRILGRFLTTAAQISGGMAPMATFSR
jgi:hypothetical protein